MPTDKQSTRKLRKAINDLATRGESTYYASVAAWHTQLEGVLEGYGFTTEAPCPTIHTDTGRGVATLIKDPFLETPTARVSYVHFQWYRMLSGNWEITCYPG